MSDVRGHAAIQQVHWVLETVPTCPRDMHWVENPLVMKLLAFVFFFSPTVYARHSADLSTAASYDICERRHWTPVHLLLL
jgi:hypothetical protein